MSDAPPAADMAGFFGRLKKRLNRGRTWVSEEIFGALGRPLDEETREGLETELLLADVGVETTQRLLDEVDASLRTDGRTSVRAALAAAILRLLEPLAVPLDPSRSIRPFVIVAVGVNGTGKTTSIGKLAAHFTRDGRSVLLAAGDTFRAAAVEQLSEWAGRAGCEIVHQAEGADPAAVVHDTLQSARARGTDIVIADTAGRLHTAKGLMDELEKIKRVVCRFDAAAPHEILLVVDASQGQNALAQAREFHRRLGVTGLVITKLDGTAKGGIVLAIARELAIPIRYIAIGESVDDFAPFDGRQFTAALLGDESLCR